MRVALVHDYIKEYGGAERVLEALHEIFPDAPIYTTLYLPQFLGPHKKRFETFDIHTSFLEYLPFKSKFISVLRIFTPFIFWLFDFSKYDVVIVSATGAYIPNTIRCHPEFISGSQINHDEKKMLNQVQHDKQRKPVHICYCHTPPRYLYGYMTARDWKKNVIFRVLGEIANHFLRLIDFKAAQNVDYFIANSEEVQSRIRKFYRRDSTVIYPPVDVDNSKFKTHPSAGGSKPQLKAQNLENKSEEYYLTGGRLARAKGIDIIIDAFVKNGKPLRVFGKGFGGYDQKFKVESSKFKVSNIGYVGEVTDEEKFELMKNAKAFIFASFDEDFGITPAEAMGAGIPVIAYKSGGVKETVIDGKTGIFYEKNTALELNKAIEKFEKIKIDPRDCIEQANKFSKERFIQEIKMFIRSKCKDQTSKPN